MTKSAFGIAATFSFLAAAFARFASHTRSARRARHDDDDNVCFCNLYFAVRGSEDSIVFSVFDKVFFVYMLPR